MVDMVVADIVALHKVALLLEVDIVVVGTVVVVRMFVVAAADKVPVVDIVVAGYIEVVVEDMRSALFEIDMDLQVHRISNTLHPWDLKNFRN